MMAGYGGVRRSNILGSMTNANAITTSGTVSLDSDYSLLRMIASRMRLTEVATLPFQHIHCHKLNDEKVAVFIAQRGEAVTLEDDYSLFPSDALITKLRLLEGK